MGKIKIRAISHKGSHTRSGTSHFANPPITLIEPPNTSHRVSHPSAQTPTKPTHPPPTGPRNIELSIAATKSQIGARSNPELEREILSKRGTRWGEMRLTVGLGERASELAMAAWLDLVWRRKRGNMGLRVWFRKRRTREREKRRTKEKTKNKRESQTGCNRYPFSTYWHPTAQIFSNFLRISNGLKAFGWTVPPFHCRLDVSSSWLVFIWGANYVGLTKWEGEEKEK